MLTLAIMPVFKGTWKEWIQALLIVVGLDILMFLGPFLI